MTLCLANEVKPTTLWHNSLMDGGAQPKRLDGHRVRPEIQALRAVAVSLVVIYHLEPRLLPGGYIGVDVFFVISGFLITGHIVRGLENPRGFRLGGFYLRRIRRLLPAALTVLAVVGLITLIRLPETTWNSIGRQIVACVFYVQNWLLAATAVDYLAAPTNTSPLEHFWSLSLEEQFYIFWPISLIIAAWIGRRLGRVRLALLVCTAGIASASFAYSILETYTNPSWAYFVTPTRVWELGLGGVLALTVPELPFAPRYRIALSWAGLVAVAASAFLMSGATAFPGYIAAVPVIGTAVVIAAGDVPGRLSTSWMINLRPTQFLGDISYSVYLWHWPFIVLTPLVIHGPGYTLPLVLRPIPVLASIFVAWLSKRYIEDRFRTAASTDSRPASSRSGLRPLLVTTGTLIAVALVIGSVLYGTTQARIERAFAELSAFEAGPQECVGAAALEGRCASRSPRGVHPDPIIATKDVVAQGCQQQAYSSTLIRCEFGANDGVTHTIAMIGDSHVQQWRQPMELLANQRKWHVSTYFKSGCPYGDGLGTPSCRQFDQAVTDSLISHPVDIVVTSARSGSGFGSLTTYDEAVAGFSSAWRKLMAHGMWVIALADTPQPIDAGIWDPPSNVETNPDFAFPRPDSDKRDAIPRAAQESGATLVDMKNSFCTDQMCPAVIGGVLVYRDGDHMTATYSRSLASALGRAIDQAASMRGGYPLPK